jgi:O-methyltransferase involved in polyketide biosynthesis
MKSFTPYQSVYAITKAIDTMAKNEDLIKPPYPKEFITKLHLDLIDESVKIFESNKIYITEDNSKEILKEKPEQAAGYNLHLSRSRQSKMRIENGIKNGGIEQVVDLGVGLNFSFVDTAVQNPKVNFFVVDVPLTAEIYQQAIEKKFPGGLPNLKVVPCELDTCDFRNNLAKAGYNPFKKTAFNIQGVLSYLRDEVQADILKFVGSESAPGSIANFTIVHQWDNTHKYAISEWAAPQLIENSGIGAASVSYNDLVKKTYNELGRGNIEIPKIDIEASYYEGICKGQEIKLDRRKPGFTERNPPYKAKLQGTIIDFLSR